MEGLLRNMSIKTKFIIILMVVLILDTAVVAVSVGSQLRSQTHEIISERLEGNTTLAMGIFETVRTYTEWMVDAVATMPYVQDALVGDSEVFRDSLRRNLGAFFTSMNQFEDGVHTYANILVFDAQLNLVAVADPAGEVVDLRDPAFFENIIMAHKGEPSVSPVVRGPKTGLTQFLFTQPVMIDGTMLGIAAIIGNTEGISFFLRDPLHGYDSFINIADSEGTIFFSNRSVYIGRHVDDLGVYEAFGYIPFNTVFYHTSAVTGIDKIAYITIEPELDWILVSFFDADAVESTAMVIFLALLPTAIVMLLASAFVILIITWSLTPLNTLAGTAKEVANGNFEINFDIRRNDEIAKVSQAFSEIVTTLNLLRDNFKKAENAMISGDMQYKLEDSRLGGVYDELFVSTNNIVRHMQRLKIEAEDASKAKSEFLSKMSHEIRTPMNAILGMAELVLREDISEAAQEQTVTIKQSGTHLLSIVNDILDLSKVESGKLELVNSEYHLHSIINDVIGIIKMRMANSGLRFAVYMEKDIPTAIFGDEIRLRQILLNVLSNAVKYTKEGFFTLDITGIEQGEGTILLTMKVRDTGIGIKPEDMERLFVEFAQFDLEENRDVEGSGLGLAIVRNLTELMGGKVEVSSEYGIGSEFIVTLPQKLCEKNPESGDENWLPEIGKTSVLLYGSTPVDTEYAARALDDLGVEYRIVSDDGELRDGLCEGKFSYVFAEGDLAYTAEQIIKARNLDTKIVMMIDSYQEKSGHDFTYLIMPAYLLSIANALSGKDTGYFTYSGHTEQFIAPDAKVLLVDDITTNLKVGEGLLKPYGMSVTSCVSGRAAIEEVTSEDYDLVFMDHMMPEMDGVEAVQIIRGLAVSKGDKYSTLPIIALTANAVVGAKEMFLQNGFNDFLSKPIEFAKLNSILAKWIPKEKQKRARNTIVYAAAEAGIEIGLDIEDVDTATGISISGGSIHNYVDTLKVFHKDGTMKLEELARCLDNGNLTLYSTYVHALKSACANIGAGKLSEAAKTMEIAGIKRDMDFIEKNRDAFFDSLKKLLGDIGEVISKDSEKSDDKAIDSDTLKDRLCKLKEGIEAFDLPTIDEIYSEFKSITLYPDDIGDAIDEILKNVFIGEYEKAISDIEKLLL